jgi:ribosomal protein S12 methylthiotransferase
MARNKKVCKYIDMPAQHSEDAVLRRMGRRGGGEAVRSAVGRLRRDIPGVALRTTFITGFPGETEQEFNALMNFTRNTKFDRLGVFEFSRESGTPAYDMKDQVPAKVKKRRKDALMRLQRDISLDSGRAKIGSRLIVVVDGKTPDGDFQGRTEADAPDIDGAVFFKHDGDIVSGTFVEVEITGASEYDLTGVFINESAE